MALVAVKGSGTAWKRCTLSFLALLVSLAGGGASPLSSKFKVYGLDTVRAGVEAFLSCFLEGSDTGGVTRPPSYVWVKDGKVIPGQTDMTLRFKVVTREDAGFYQCGAPGSDVGDQGRQLHVVVPGDILPKPSVDYRGHPVCGRPYSINCKFLERYIPSDHTVYTWYKNHAQVKGQTGPTLSFPNVTEADGGEYVCTGREGPYNTTSPPSQVYHMEPFVAPQVTMDTPSSVARGILGHNLTLTARVIKAVPQVPRDGYSWSYFPFSQGQQRHLAERTSTLTLGPLTLEDRGQYFCQARNDQDNRELQLIGHASVTVDVVFTTEHLATELATREPHSTYAATTNLTEGEESPKDDKTKYAYLGFLAVIPIAGFIFALLWRTTNCRQRRGRLGRCTRKKKDLGNEGGSNNPDDVEMNGDMHEANGSIEEQARLLQGPGNEGGSNDPDDLEIDGDKQEATGSNEEQARLLQVPGNEGGSKNSVVAEQNDGIAQDSGSSQEQAVLIHEDRNDANTRDISELTSRRPQEENATGNTTGSQFNIANEDDLVHLRKRPSKTEPKEVPPQKGQKVRFDDVYKKGSVQVLPPRPVAGTPLTAGREQHEGGDGDGGTAALVIELLQAALAAAIRDCPDKPPVFVFTQALPRNVHAIVYKRHCGAIIVKAKKAKIINGEARRHLRLAARQLVRAKKKLKEELQHQLHEDRITTVLALPYLTDIDGNLLAKLQEDDIRVLCGQETAKYKELFDCKADNVWGPGGDSDFAFRTAVTRYLSMTSYGDNDDPPTWLVTPEQASVLQCTDKLVHVWGPPGSGKTLLLLDRVRRWLWRGKTVVLAVASPSYELLLHRLNRTTIKGMQPEGQEALRLCTNTKDFKRMVAKLKEPVPSSLCVAVDDIDDEFLQVLLQAYQSCPHMNAWITSQGDLRDTAGFQASRGRTAHLPHSLRFTEKTLHLAKKLLPAGRDFEACKDWSCLPFSLPSASVQHALHSSHTGYQSTSPPSFACKDCDDWLAHSLTPLIKGGSAEWRRWIILLTGDWGSEGNVLQELTTWLKQQGVPAVLEWQPDTQATSLQAANEERAALLSRVESSLDKASRPAVHVMRGSLFRGLEKPCVLVVHYDWRDGSPDKQSQDKRDARLAKHCKELVRAVTCCQEALAVLFLSPSPAAAKLQ